MAEGVVDLRLERALDRGRTARLAQFALKARRANLDRRLADDGRGVLRDGHDARALGKLARLVQNAGKLKRKVRRPTCASNAPMRAPLALNASV